MRLLLDVGNTRIKWRLLELDLLVKSGSDLRSDYSFNGGSPDWLSCVESVWVSSVHDKQNQWIESQFSNVQYAIVKEHQAGLKNSYADVSAMGIDRWLAMLAVVTTSKKKSHIVIDAGTAITLDVVDKQGCHLGGYICPGLNMMKQSLLGGTSKVEAGSDWGLGRELGRETQECVDHGIQDMVVSWLERHLESRPEAVVTISGGDGKVLAELLGRPKNYHPELVLDGLNMSFKNK